MASSKTPRKPAAAKPAARPAASRAGSKASPAPQPDAPEVSTERRTDLTAEELRRFIAEAAYFRAQKRGFAPGYELQDWVEAEAEVRSLIGRGP